MLLKALMQEVNEPENASSSAMDTDMIQTATPPPPAANANDTTNATSDGGNQSLKCDMDEAAGLTDSLSFATKMAGNFSSKSKYGKIELKILQQPEEQHR